jgi:capsular polysaccharide biosynthesis protein
LTLKTFLAAVGRYWQTLVVVTGVVVAIGLTWVMLTSAKFVSTTQLMVSIQGSTTAAAYQNDQVVAGRINSYIPLLSSGVVTQRVIDKLGLSMTAAQLAAEISATNVPPKTSIIDVAVTDESPQQARLIADALAQEFISYTTALETPTGEDSQEVRTTVVTAASEPSEHRFQRVALGVLAALAGLLAGAVAVWIRSRIDPVVRTPDRAAAAAGVPVLGRVTSAPVVTVDELEGYRLLRTRLRSATSTGGGGMLEIASVSGEVDATVVASDLGRAMELAGSRSIVLDAALPESGVARPAADTQPRQDPADGDGNGGSDRAETNGNDWPEPEHGPDGFPDTLDVSTWAAEPDVVATKAATKLVDWLRSDYEHVIIAAPPVLSTLTASAAVSEYADAVLLVISAGTTNRRDLSRAAQSLRATGAPLIGVVLVGKVDDGTGPAELSSAKALGSER